MRAAAELPLEQNPAVVGVRTTFSGDLLPDCFAGLPEFPLTRTTAAEPVWCFDRRTPLQGHSMLDYSVVVNWVIAEHKSQGMFQMEYGRRPFEHFWLFAMGGAAAHDRWDRFATLMTLGQQPVKPTAASVESRGNVYA